MSECPGTGTKRPDILPVHILKQPAGKSWLHIIQPTKPAFPINPLLKAHNRLYKTKISAKQQTMVRTVEFSLEIEKGGAREWP